MESFGDLSLAEGIWVSERELCYAFVEKTSVYLVSGAVMADYGCREGITFVLFVCLEY